jgi:ribonuclease R
LTPLKWAGELAIILQKLRKERGAIGFTLPEPDIGLDDTGRISTIGRAERNFAHEIIEQFMLSANEAVAETFTEHSVNALYRIHERPDPIKVQEFTGFAKTLGLNLPKHREDPDWFGQVLDMVKGSPKEYVVNNLLLRTMQQARYDARNVGHFGLAATDYTHFTSPIRRYPDLLVHRALYDFISRSKENKKNLSAENLKIIGPFLSTRERVAVSAEREMNDRLKVRYMQNKIGESFDAVISGVNGFAFFVELLELFISGSVAIGELHDDYYIYDAKHHRLMGERSAKMYRIGDLVRVTLLDVDPRKNRINFTLAKE